MPPRRILTVLLFSLFFLLSSFVSAADMISELLEHWLEVETALYNWQGGTPGSPAAAADETPPANTVSENLFSSLEQFIKILENLTGSLLFYQYEGTRLLPQDGGKTTLLMAKELTASVKSIAAMEAAGVPQSNTLAAKTALAQKADTIRRQLYSWSSVDSQTSSSVFTRSIYIFGVFSFFVISMVIV